MLAAAEYALKPVTVNALGPDFQALLNEPRPRRILAGLSDVIVPIEMHLGRKGKVEDPLDERCRNICGKPDHVDDTAGLGPGLLILQSLCAVLYIKEDFPISCSCPGQTMKQINRKMSFSMVNGGP